VGPRKVVSSGSGLINGGAKEGGRAVCLQRKWGCKSLLKSLQIVGKLASGAGEEFPLNGTGGRSGGPIGLSIIWGLSGKIRMKLGNRSESRKSPKKSRKLHPVKIISFVGRAIGGKEPDSVRMRGGGSEWGENSRRARRALRAMTERRQKKTNNGRIRTTADKRAISVVGWQKRTNGPRAGPKLERPERKGGGYKKEEAKRLLRMPARREREMSGNTFE